jgi:hypothetical protein
MMVPPKGLLSSSLLVIFPFEMLIHSILVILTYMLTEQC